MFDHQSEIEPANLVAKLTRSIKAAETDLREFQSCLDANGATGRIDDDMALGQALNISATPTLFINGQRLVGVKTAAETEEQISWQIHVRQ